MTYAIGIADQPKYQLINIRCTSLDMQADVAEGLYGKQFYYYFTKKDVREQLKKFEGIYSNEILKRVENIIYNQMRKYNYLQK